MPEAIDRLQLVADGEQVASVQRPQDRQLAGIGVLELVDHQQLEAIRPGRAHRLALLQQLLREQLEIIEVGARARTLELLVGDAETREQLVEQHAPRRGIDVELARIAGGLCKRQPRQALTAAAQLQVGLLDHPPHAIDAVSGDQVDCVDAIAGEQLAHGDRKGLVAQAPGQPLLDDREIGVEADGERMGAQQPGAEAVEGSDVRRLGVARSLAVAELQQAIAHALAQLARGALGERDREDPPGRNPIVADGRDEALDEHGRLAAPGGSGNEQRLRTPADRCALLVGQCPDLAAREREHASRLHAGERLQLRCADAP